MTCRVISAVRRAIPLLLTAAALLAVVAPAARAQTDMAPATDVSARGALVAERQRLRRELERMNGEIDRLKREGRGIGDDYRLRARLADAEALARRLTTLDAELGEAAPPARAAAPRPSAEPAASPTDGPAEIEAKADILADQSRRLAAQSAALQQRVGQLRARQDLRRRVGQMERDPFSPLEGSKRRTVSAAQASAGAPRVPLPTDAQPAPSSGGAAGAPPGTPTTISAGAGHAVSAPSSPPTPTGSAAFASPEALSVQLRDLLDAASLAEIRRLETSGSPSADLQALERAATALRARADRLAAASNALRARGRAAVAPR